LQSDAGAGPDRATGLPSTEYGIFNCVGDVVSGMTVAAAGALKAAVGPEVSFQRAAGILFISAFVDATELRRAAD
jgi:hypothetical protein